MWALFTLMMFSSAAREMDGMRHAYLPAKPKQQGALSSFFVAVGRCPCISSKKGYSNHLVREDLLYCQCGLALQRSSGCWCCCVTATAAVFPTFGLLLVCQNNSSPPAKCDALRKRCGARHGASICKEKGVVIHRCVQCTPHYPCFSTSSHIVAVQLRVVPLLLESICLSSQPK